METLNSTTNNDGLERIKNKKEMIIQELKKTKIQLIKYLEVQKNVLIINIYIYTLESR